MTLQRKTLTYVCIVLAVQLAVLAAVAMIVHFEVFERLERVFAVNGADNVRMAFNDEMHRISILADDYYCWNELYDFVAAPGPSFPEENLTATSMQALGINVMVCVDTQGRAVLRRSVAADGKLTELPASVETLVRRVAADHPDLLAMPRHISVARLPEGVLLYTVRSILHNDRSGPPQGYGLMGRWLDAGMLSAYGKTSGMHLSLLSGNSGELFVGPADELDPSRVVLSGDEARIVLTFTDYTGAPQFSLEASRELVVSRYGARATIILLGTMAFLTLIACFTTVILLNRLVLQRISGMAAQVRRIGEGGNSSGRLKVHASDEIGRLGDDINALLDKLRASADDLGRKDEQLRLLLDKNPLGITISDREGHVVYANESFCRMTGRSFNDLGTIDHMMALAMPDPAYRRKKLDQLAASLEESRRTGLPARPVEYRACTAFGKELDIELYVAEAGGFAFRIRNDVTERNRMTRELREALATRDHFLANVSHEIRTPLNGIVGMTQILRDTKITSEQRDCVDTISESCELLVSIINDILDISKIESGTMKLSPGPVALQPFIAGVVSLVGHNMTMKGLDFTCSAPDELPPAVVCDGNRLKQVLLNLLSNSLKFTEKGGVELRVSFEGGGENAGTLSFAVTDTGIGIAPVDQERIFKPFEQVDSAYSRKHGGTGLGLAISMRLVERMGGKLVLESVQGRGSTFRFGIPVATVSAGSAPRERSVSENLRPLAERHCALSILVAEDNLVNQKVIGVMLKKMGADPDFAFNGEEAVALALRRKYDVILMDIQMPVMDGIEATRRLRAVLPPERQPAIVALTAHARAEDAELCLSSGMDSHLTKPLKAQDLLHVLTEICDQRHSGGNA